ncbi:MAG: sialidase family protein [Gemmatimonadales bacterium]
MATSGDQAHIPGMRSLAAVLTALTVACASDAELAPIDDWTGPAGSRTPFLAGTADGGLLLTWFEPRGDSAFALQLARRGQDGWSPPITVASHRSFFVNWADFPSAVETSTGAWVVHWLEKVGASAYAYHVMLTRSEDEGKTWSAPVVAHQDSSQTEHGFVAMVPDSVGGVSVTWLDGGRMVDSGGTMTVRNASYTASGSTTNEQVLDPRTCECCQVSMARTASGLVAAYRDRSETEVRDIAVVRERDGAWSAPVSVATDGWIIRACPVNGPAIAARDSGVAVSWYTGASDTPRVRLAFSSDGGASFNPPVTLDDGKPLGRVHLQLTAPDRGVAVWLEDGDSLATWRLRMVKAGAATEPSLSVATTDRGRRAGFARTALVGSDLYLTWADPGTAPAESRVRVVRVPLSQ